MRLDHPPAGPPLKWFIGVQVYGLNGEAKWVVRGPFGNEDNLERAYAELKAIDKVATKPYQAGSLAEARKLCALQGRNDEAL